MPLVLDSLEIKNFRAFKHLRIEKLGRVNLIVGKNNVGKSSVLEALQLYENCVDPLTVLAMLTARDEVARYEDSQSELNALVVHERILALRHLFYGRQDVREAAVQLEIGPIGSEDNKISISVNLPSIVDGDTGEMRLPPGHQGKTMRSGEAANPGLFVDIGTQFRAYYTLDQGRLPALYATSSPGYFKTVKVILVEADGLNMRRTASLWDSIVLSDLQSDVIAALKIIAPSTVNLNLIDARQGANERIPIVKMQGLSLPIPLRSMGEGMNRMLGIALALVNAKDGMLLIDEVDTGLHYSVLPDLWKLIFEVAHRLNVQVFATSHSWDCIQAFQSAAEENKEEEGVVIRLETQDGEVVPVTFDERKLSIATREQIEVR